MAGAMLESEMMGEQHERRGRALIMEAKATC